MVQDLVDQAGTNYLKMIQSVSKFVLPLAAQVFERSRAASQGADLIIHSFLLTSTGIGLAQEQGIPNISAQLFPIFSSTAAFPGPTFPDLPLGDGYRRLTHQIISQTFKSGSRYLYQKIRRKTPALPELTSWIPGDQGVRHIPILYGFSSHVVPKPQDWDTHAHLTGYWLLDGQMEQPPPQNAVDFTQSGPPPLSIAFGSTMTKKLPEIKRKVTAALIQCQQRGIIISRQIDPEINSPDILQLDYAPYSWLFKHSAAVIHHGGAGTTARGLMAGVPNITLPFTSDQPFWGRQVHALGAGPRAIPVRGLTTLKLIRAINQAITDQNMKARAQKIGEKLSQEDGSAQAVKIIESYLAS